MGEYNFKAVHALQSSRLTAYSAQGIMLRTVPLPGTRLPDSRGRRPRIPSEDYVYHLPFQDTQHVVRGFEICSQQTGDECK